MINMLVIGEYKLLLFLAICQKLKISWHCEFFVYTGTYGIRTFKMVLLYAFRLISPNFMT